MKRGKPKMDKVRKPKTEASPLDKAVRTLKRLRKKEEKAKQLGKEIEAAEKAVKDAV